MDVSVLYKIPNDNVIWESSESSDNEEVDNNWEKEENITTIDNTVEHVYIMNKIDDISEWSGVTSSIKRGEIGLTY